MSVEGEVCLSSGNDAFALFASNAVLLGSLLSVLGMSHFRLLLPVFDSLSLGPSSPLQSFLWLGFSALVRDLGNFDSFVSLRGSCQPGLASPLHVPAAAGPSLLTWNASS